MKKVTLNITAIADNIMEGYPVVLTRADETICTLTYEGEYEAKPFKVQLTKRATRTKTYSTIDRMIDDLNRFTYINIKF